MCFKQGSKRLLYRCSGPLLVADSLATRMLYTLCTQLYENTYFDFPYFIKNRYTLFWVIIISVCVVNSFDHLFFWNWPIGKFCFCCFSYFFKIENLIYSSSTKSSIQKFYTKVICKKFYTRVLWKFFKSSIQKFYTKVLYKSSIQKFYIKVIYKKLYNKF